MTPHDKPAFAHLIAMLGEYYGREISEGLIGMYWQGLEEYDIEAIRDALNRHMRNPDTGSFMPRIADITRMLHGSTQDSALRAWAKVDKAVRHVGTYQSVVFDDPLIHAVVQDMGGWVGLGSRTEDEWPFVAREFETRYRGYRVRLASRDYPRVLIGISEAHNARTGKAIQPPVLIGDQAAAQRVIAGGSSAPAVGFRPAASVVRLAATASRAARSPSPSPVLTNPLVMPKCQ